MSIKEYGSHDNEDERTFAHAQDISDALKHLAKSDQAFLLVCDVEGMDELYSVVAVNGPGIAETALFLARAKKMVQEHLSDYCHRITEEGGGQ